VRRNIVLIDDDLRILTGLERFLRSHLENVEVSFFTSPFDALCGLQLDQERIHLVISDFEMPGKNGIVLYEEAKELLEKMPPWIIYSGASGKAFYSAIHERNLTLVAKPEYGERLLSAVIQKLAKRV